MNPMPGPGRPAIEAARWWLPAVLGVEILLFLPALIAGGVIRPPLPKFSESTGQFYPWGLFWRDEVLAGRAPFWNPFSFAGLPMAGEPQAHTFYPDHLFWLILPPETAYTLTFLTHVLVAAWLMYRLAREIGANRFGASIAALAFGLHGQVVTFVSGGWSPHTIALCLAPGVVWMVCRAFRRPERWPAGAIVGAGALLGLQIIGGHPEWVRYTMFIIGLLALGSGAIGRPLQSRVSIVLSVVVLGLFIGGIQLLPMAEAARHSARGQEALSTGQVAPGAGLPLLTLPTVLVPRLFGPWDATVSTDGLIHKLSGSRVSYGESLIYVGVLPLFLSIVAWRRRRETGSTIWAVIAVVGLLFALNEWTHLQDALDRVITIDAVFRSPARFVFLTNFGLAVMAGLGASQLAVAGREIRGVCRAAVAMAIVIVPAAALGWALRARLVDWVLGRVHVPASLAADPLVADGGRALGLWAVEHSVGSALVAALFIVASAVVLLRAARAITPPVTRTAIFMLVAADLGFFASPLLTSVVPVARAYAADRALLAPIVGDRTAAVTASAPSAFAGGANVTIALRVRSLLGNDTFSVNEWDRLSRVTNGAGPETLAAAGVTHLVQSRDRAQALSRLPQPRGHAWWTDRVQIVDTPDAAAALLPTLGAEGGVALEADHATAQSGAGSDRSAARVTIDRDVPGSLLVRTQAPLAGWLIVTEIFYPGWRATVNGRAVPIARAFGAFQAVPVPAGESQVDLAFRPTIVSWGAGMSALGLVAGLVMLRIKRPNR